MFRRCIYYFMIGMIGFAYSILGIMFGSNSSGGLFALGILGRIIFYLMSSIFLVELMISFFRPFKKMTSKDSHQ